MYCSPEERGAVMDVCLPRMAKQTNKQTNTQKTNKLTNKQKITGQVLLSPNLGLTCPLPALK
jgi:hypothetical protein